jgi:hypothetical protein
MGRKFGVTAIPRAILVDKDGVIVSASARGPALGEHLQKLLGDTASADASPTGPNVEE